MTDTWDIRRIAWPADVPSAVGALAADDEIAWLDACADVAVYPRGARWSLVCVRPVARLTQYEGRHAELHLNGRVIAAAADGWQLWREAIEACGTAGPCDLPVAPGWVGYVGFEMARLLERLPATRHEDLGLPLLHTVLFDRGIVLDHVKRVAYAVAMPGVSRRIGADAVPGDDWIERWNAAAGVVRAFPRVDASCRSELDSGAHGLAVRSALAYIAAGDIYQVNLARRIELRGLLDPFAAYAALRRRNPAPYAAYLRWEDGAILSASPELFLELRGERVLTRPIKGTRPRTGLRRADRLARRELLASAKEAAELTMIVDLHRNDLGRVCRYGSVRVVEPRAVEAHPTVFHTVADVVGRLASPNRAIDLLRACFPAGSISGVPKIRALEIIDVLEAAPRGAYTGAVGVLGLDGNMTFNVAIRTVQWRPDRAVLHVGGGIVADSDPAAEYAETTAKARGILRGLGCEPMAEDTPRGRLACVTG